MLISPTEPQRLRDLGKTSLTPEKHGCDILILQGKTRVGVQRKKFPNDFLASLTDGRLYTQLPLMMELGRAFVIIEGHGQWTPDGELLGSTTYQRFTLDQLYGLFYSIMFEFGVPVLWLRDMNATIHALEVLDHWAAKTKHRSLKSRPGPGQDTLGRVSDRAWAEHLIQGFPGVGAELAGRMVEHFECVPLTWTVSVDELMEVQGIGKVKAKRMYEALEIVNG
jgi:ERCC4-type nuclease